VTHHIFYLPSGGVAATVSLVALLFLLLK